MKRNVTDFALYRFRYAIGYLVLLLSITGLLLLAGLYVPGGIRAEEISSIATSSSLSFANFDPQTAINLPYHLLQRLSLMVFSVSIFSIKLPSILFGIAAITGIYLLIREWFRNNIAIITTLLAATMPMFLFMAQDGTPTIYVSALSVWLLYAATLVSRRRAPTLTWKVILFILIALNLYAPLGLYVTIAVATTVIFHPHVRHTIKSFNPAKLATATAAFLLLLVPLIYSLVVKPELGLTLLGVPSALPDITQQSLAAISILFNSMGGSTNGVMHPLISTGLIVIILIGIYRFFLIKYTARSYIIWFWTLLLIPFVVLNTAYLPYLYPLIAIMIAMGISTLISVWYKTFPKNPYARVIGLIPLSVIVIGISMSGVNRYALSYTYDPELRQSFSHDIQLLSSIKSHVADDTITVIVDAKEAQLYRIVEKFDETLVVSLEMPTTINGPVVVTSEAKRNTSVPGLINAIITDSRKTDADRFYVYTPLEK